MKITMLMLCKPKDDRNKKNVLSIKESKRKSNKKTRYEIVKCQQKPFTLKRQSRYRLELEPKEYLEKRTSPFFLSIPSDRIGEPTREGVRTAVLRLRGCHAGDDSLDSSRVFWVNRWLMRERRMKMTKLGKGK